MNIQNMPSTGFLRVSQILTFIPIGKSKWWAGVKAGEYPACVKLGNRITAWRVEDIKALIEKLSQTSPSSFTDNSIHLRNIAKMKKIKKKLEVLEDLIHNQDEVTLCQ
jgi:predicted DNA-binding transcriptional regulator AlpA